MSNILAWQDKINNSTVLWPNEHTAALCELLVKLKLFKAGYILTSSRVVSIRFKRATQK